MADRSWSTFLAQTFCPPPSKRTPPMTDAEITLEPDAVIAKAVALADSLGGEDEDTIMRLVDALSRSTLPREGQGEVVAWQWSDFSGKWYTVDTNTDRLSEQDQEELARSCAKTHEGRVRPVFASPSPAVRDGVVTDAMIEAGHRAHEDGGWNDGTDPKSIYAAMVAAKPARNGDL